MKFLCSREPVVSWYSFLWSPEHLRLWCPTSREKCMPSLIVLPHFFFEFIARQPVPSWSSRCIAFHHTRPHHLAIRGWRIHRPFRPVPASCMSATRRDTAGNFAAWPRCQARGLRSTWRRRVRPPDPMTGPALPAVGSRDAFAFPMGRAEQMIGSVVVITSLFRLPGSIVRVHVKSISSNTT